MSDADAERSKLAAHLLFGAPAEPESEPAAPVDSDWLRALLTRPDPRRTDADKD